MRFTVFLVFGAIAAAATTNCVACNGGGGAGGGTSAATGGIPALRAGTGFGTASVFASTGSSGVQRHCCSNRLISDCYSNKCSRS